MDSKARRSTSYLDPDLHRALRLKSAITDQSVSELVNEAVRLLLAEDAEDLQAVDDPVAEPTLSFDAFVRRLKADGKL